MLIAGIDEAGRGPCLGPMVLAVTTIEKRFEERLLEIGVKDSKMLSPKQRLEQFGQIKIAVNEFATVHIEPQELDALMDWRSLNEIEAMKIGFLLNNLKQKPEIVFVDAPDVIEANFSRRIRKYIDFETTIRSEHKADVNYPIVSSASIIAKVERDKKIEELAKKFGCVGSGYSHDPLTIAFLKKWVQEHKALPPFARKAWGTSKRIEGELFQKKLFQLE